MTEAPKATLLDGTSVFKTPEEELQEQHVASMVEELLGVAVRSLGKLAPVRWYATTEDGQVKPLLDLRQICRPVNSVRDIMFPLRIWTAMLLGRSAFKVPGTIIPLFDDDIRWIDVDTIPPGGVRIEVPGDADTYVISPTPSVAITVTSMTRLSPTQAG